MSDEWRDLVQPGLAGDFFAVGAMPRFEAVTDRFCPRLAVWMAEFSRLVYRQESGELGATGGSATRSEFLKKATHQWREHRFFNGLAIGEKRKRRFWRPALPAEDTNASLFVSEELNCTVLAFRGTLGILNLLTDMSILAWPLRFKMKGSAHHGFSAALDTIWEEIIDALRTTTGRIFVTGHSLGGALATLAVCRMLGDARLAERMGALYTFGSPRVGTAGFEENFEPIYHARVVHGDDLVARVPPAFAIPPFPTYRHIGWLHRLSEDGRISATSVPNEDTKEGKAGAMETWSLLREMVSDVRLETMGAPVKALKDHTPLHYTRALHRALERGEV